MEIDKIDYRFSEKEIMKKDGVSKKNKPYQAFIKFFDENNNPKVEELEKLRKHPKLQQIFFSIYQEKI